MNTSDPLIITLVLDADSAAFFNALRKQYFPAAINYIDAHLTLFHHLPGGEEFLLKDLENWSREQKAITLQVAELKSIGRGVAYQISSPDLLQLHLSMQQKWKQWLTPQDKQKLWPHISVQNKVSPLQAKETLQTLQLSFQAFTAIGWGFQLWAYKGGPWELLQTAECAKRYSAGLKVLSGRETSKRR